MGEVGLKLCSVAFVLGFVCFGVLFGVSKVAVAWCQGLERSLP